MARKQNTLMKKARRDVWSLLKHQTLVFVCLLFVLSFSPTLLFVPAQRVEAADSGLQMHWQLDEGSGTTATDSSGNNKTGTLYEGPSYQAGVYDTGVEFDGIGQYIQSNDPIASLGTVDEPYALSAWVKFNDGETNANIIHISSNANGGDWCIPFLRLENSRFNATGWTDEGATSAAAVGDIVADQWYQVLTSWDPTNGLRLFVNGTLVDSTPQDNFAAYGSPVYFSAGLSNEGCSEDQGFLDGMVDDVRLYNRALTDDDIDTIQTGEQTEHEEEPEPSIFDGGDGSELDPFQITECEQIQELMSPAHTNYLGLNFKLMDNVDCSETNPEDPDFDESGPWSNEKGFKPIGGDSPYVGDFDGNNKAITGLYINRPDENLTGLFAKVGLNGLVHDLSVTGANVTGRQGSGVLAGLVDGTIENCHTSGTLVGDDEVGGLVGGHEGWDTIRDSSSSVNVTGENSVGGLVGVNYGNIYDSHATGNVAGLIGVGGFVGSSNSGTTIEDSYATGDVLAMAQAGGFIGGGFEMMIDSSYATGDVTATGHPDIEMDGVGGFAGTLVYMYVNSAYSTGDVIAPDAVAVGGFVGYATIMAAESYSLSGVQGGAGVGGFVGVMDCYGGEVHESFSNNDVIGFMAVGGFAGTLANGCTVEDSYTLSDVTVVEGVGAGFAFSIDLSLLRNVYSGATLETFDTEDTDSKGFATSLGEEVGIENSFWDMEVNQRADDSDAVALDTETMQSLETYTLGEWDMQDVWALGEEENEGYACLRWSETSCSISFDLPDEDGDGLSDFNEDSGPNEGDANNDNINDSEQGNVVSFVNGFTMKPIAIELSNEDCVITDMAMRNEETLGQDDPDFEYSDGMVHFEADCGEDGVEVVVKLFYYDVEDGDYIVRKYSALSESFGPIDSATIVQDEIDERNVTTAFYTVVDGGEFDDDGEENGSIVDPAGLASAATVTDVDVVPTDDALAETGDGLNIIFLTAAMSLIGLSAFVAFLSRKKKFSNE